MRQDRVSDPIVSIMMRVFGVLLVTTLAIGGVMANFRANADNPASATASVFVSSACTMSGGNNDYVDTLANGEAKVFGPSTIKAVCNDASGLAIYAVGYSGDTTTGGNNDKMLARNTSTAGSTNIITATDDNPGSGSYWAMQINAVSGTYAPTIENSFDRTDYHIVPTDLTKVASLSSATDQGESAVGSSINANYKVSINATQPADEYTGKVKYVLVHPNTFSLGTYNINYLANGGTGTMTSQTDLANYEDQTLSPLSSGTITPPTGYRFVGWCDTQESTPATASNPQTTCPGNHYTDADTIPSSTISASSSPTNLNLYAVYNQITSQITLNQNGATTSSDPTTLTATYGRNTLSPATITNPEKSYSATGFTMGTYASGANVTFPSTGNCTSASSCTYSNTFNGWYNTSSATGGTQIITTAGALTPSNGWTDANSNWTSTSDQTVYARWSAGTSITLPTITKTGYNCGWSENSSASTYTYESGYSGLTLDSNKTLYGICEIKSNLSLKVSFDSNVSQIEVREGTTTGTLKGTVTTSGTSVSGLLYNMQYYLIPTYASGYELNAWSQDTGTVNYPNAISSTSAANPYYQVGDGSNGVTLASKSGCATYMQNLTSSTIATLLPSIGSTATVCDARDDQSYTIAKLADGKYWMTENLNLAGGTALSSADTNVTDAYISSFTTSNNLTKSGNTIVLPASSTSGFSTNNYSYVYNSGNKSSNCANKQPCYSYYSWDAATLGSGRSISTDNQNAQRSICPKNWKLPTTYNGTNSSTNFRALMVGYGGSSSVQNYTPSTTPTGATMLGLTGPGSTPNFLLAGSFSNGSFSNGGSYGYYWSSTSYSNTNSARNSYFNSSVGVYSANSSYRYNGYSVRCVFSGS